jgi:GNAT superfamily N-acetyltransferase
VAEYLAAEVVLPEDEAEVRDLLSRLSKALRSAPPAFLPPGNARVHWSDDARGAIFSFQHSADPGVAVEVLYGDGYLRILSPLAPYRGYLPPAEAAQVLEATLTGELVETRRAYGPLARGSLRAVTPAGTSIELGRFWSRRTAVTRRSLSFDRERAVEEECIEWRVMGSIAPITLHSIDGMARMIRRCGDDERDAILAIVNTAAEAYRRVIPADRWREPYMPGEELDAEIAAGVVFWGYEADGELVGVMGVQPVRDVELIRHAYVAPGSQRRGIGGALLEHLLRERDGTQRVLVGTWAAAEWAISFYRRHGFEPVEPERAAALLRAYWTIPERQVETSVVLERSG